MLQSWIGPKQYQFAFVPFGVFPDAWCCLSFYNTFFHHANDGEAPLEVTSILSSPLLSCLAHHQPDEASRLLRYVYALHMPSLSHSLEFMVHSALNHGSPSLLHETLLLLSSLPLFPAILVDCLRKEERSTWKKALHNPLDILFIFRACLNHGAIAFATATISVLQGVDCSASEFALPHPSSPSSELHSSSPSSELNSSPSSKLNSSSSSELNSSPSSELHPSPSNDLHPTPLPSDLYLWCDEQCIREHIRPDYAFLLDLFPFVWKRVEGVEGECVAHKAGIELLLMSVMRSDFSSVSDVYRFVLMEENRHAEMDHPLPHLFHVDVILTTCALSLLNRGLLSPFLSLTKAIPFTWTTLPSPISVTNFAGSLERMKNASALPLPPQDIFEETDLFQEMVARCRNDDAGRYE